MRCVFFLLAFNAASAQTFIHFDPAVVTRCAGSGLGRGTVSWNYDGLGPVEVRVGTADGTALTGPAAPQGSMATGDWVTDGMTFLLTLGGAQELARTSAVVRCNPAGEVLAPAMASASYFPLQVGDDWIYSYSTRFISDTYVTRRVVRADLIGDVAWFVLEETVNGVNQPTVSWFRNDDMGRIYQLTNQGEQLWLDPTASPAPSASLSITGRGGPVSVPAGTFENSLSYRVIHAGLDLETGTFAKGIGLVMNSHDMLTGSSGGFTEGLTLVSARIDGHIVFASPANSLELAAEAASFDVSSRRAANCAVPCYFAACGIAPGADPPGTYKPCFQARVRMGQRGSDLQSCDLDLLDSSNHSVFHATLMGTADSQSNAAQQVPLYKLMPAQPFGSSVEILPLGTYQLRAQTPDGRVSTAPIQLR